MADVEHSGFVKVCTSCGATKPATSDNFSRNPGGKFGLRGQCIPCYRSAARERRQRPQARVKLKLAYEGYRDSGRRAVKQRAWRLRWKESGKRCCLPDCNRPSQAFGWCAAHYRRWKRHGDPLAGRTPPGDPERYLAEVVLLYGMDDCLPWPYARTASGYGNIWLNGENFTVSRLVCERANGAPPSSEYEAAHSCGKGHEGCVAPLHLSWKLPAENMADKVGHGTDAAGERNGQAKLSEADALAILKSRGTATHAEIAARFGVSPALVSRIFRGLAWRHLSKKERAPS